MQVVDLIGMTVDGYRLPGKQHGRGRVLLARFNRCSQMAADRGRSSREPQIHRR